MSSQDSPKQESPKQECPMQKCPICTNPITCPPKDESATNYKWVTGSLSSVILILCIILIFLFLRK